MKKNMFYKVFFKCLSFFYSLYVVCSFNLLFINKHSYYNNKTFRCLHYFTFILGIFYPYIFESLYLKPFSLTEHILKKNNYIYFFLVYLKLLNLNTLFINFFLINIKNIYGYFYTCIFDIILYIYKLVPFFIKLIIISIYPRAISIFQYIIFYQKNTYINMIGYYIRFYYTIVWLVLSFYLLILFQTLKFINLIFCFSFIYILIYTYIFNVYLHMKHYNIFLFDTTLFSNLYALDHRYFALIYENYIRYYFIDKFSDLENTLISSHLINQELVKTPVTYKSFAYTWSSFAYKLIRWFFAWSWIYLFYLLYSLYRYRFCIWNIYRWLYFK